jgi:hypothetical protein
MVYLTPPGTDGNALAQVKRQKVKVKIKQSSLALATFYFDFCFMVTAGSALEVRRQANLAQAP